MNGESKLQKVKVRKKMPSPLKFLIGTSLSWVVKA